MHQNQRTRPAVTRRHALRKMAVAGLTLAGPASLTSSATPVTEAAACSDSAQEVVDTALLIEQLAMTFYYAGLTTPVIAGNRKVTGLPGDLGSLPLRSDPGHVACLKAALAQEHEHARMLKGVGARSAATRFYFPRQTFADLGYTSHPSVFLWALDHIETATVGAYLAAIQRLGTLGHHATAMLAVRILGTECEHRALGRTIAQDTPVNNVTLEVVALSCMRDAITALAPFLTGHGFQERSTITIPVPTDAQVERVTRHVRGLG